MIYFKLTLDDSERNSLMIRKNMKTYKEIIARSMTVSDEMMAWICGEEGMDNMLDIKDEYEMNCLLLEKIYDGKIDVLGFIDILDRGGQENIANICLDGNLKCFV